MYQPILLDVLVKEGLLLFCIKKKKNLIKVDLFHNRAQINFQMIMQKILQSLTILLLKELNPFNIKKKLQKKLPNEICRRIFHLGTAIHNAAILLKQLVSIDAL